MTRALKGLSKGRPTDHRDPTEPPGPAADTAPPESLFDPDAAVDAAESADGQDGAGGPDALSDGVEAATPLSRAHLRGLLEALVFASDKPVTAHELARLSSAPSKAVKELLVELKAEFAGRGIVLDEVAGGWIFRTHVAYAPFVRDITSERPVKLTRAQIETLAIAAYRQPITRPEIDEIRGVDSGATLKILLERDLVRIIGKKDEPGRPHLYGTTTHFLEFFGLKSLRDLPTLREFTELSDESKRVAEAELDEVVPAVASVTPSDSAGATEPPAAEPMATEPPTTEPMNDEPPTTEPMDDEPGGALP